MSAKLVKAVSISVAVLLACALIYAFVINRPDPPDADPASERGRGTKQPASRDLLFDGVAVEGREGGERVWMLSAARVETGAGDGRAEMYKITEGAIYRSGEPYLTFSAGRGLYDSKTGQLRLDGGVKVASGGKEAEGKHSLRIEGDNICFSSDGESFEARGETTIQFELDDSED